MRRISALLVALLVLLVAAPSRAEPSRSPPSPSTKQAPRKKRVRARAQPKHKPSRQPADEITLGRDLIEQLQRNLIEGGYLQGRVDGTLNARTHRALALFQREYHLPPTGRLDRPTAEALLGRDEIATALSQK